MLYETKTGRIVLISLMTSAAMIFSYIESLFPLNFQIPGIKMGLANVVTVYMLYKTDAKSAFLVNLIRVLLSALLFGNTITLIYSVSGALLSFFGSFLLKKTGRFKTLTVSISGGVLHNAGQLIAASFIIGSKKIMYYLPVLIISGIICGLVTGVIGHLFIKYIPLKKNK